MRQDIFLKKIESNPIIASVKDDAGLEKALASDVEIIFILYGNLCTIADITEKIHNAGKVAIVHLDMINGLSPTRESAVDFIRQYTAADGIITTKLNLVERAVKDDLRCILRCFVLDSMAIENIKRQTSITGIKPDLIEILPGIIRGKMIQRIRDMTNLPIIAGGLIVEKEDVLYALNNGALAISSTNEKVWEL